MIRDTLARIEGAIARAGTLDIKHRAELIALLNKLKAELASLPEAHHEDAASLANFTQAATHEAARKNADARLRSLSIEALERSVKNFEASHPVLVDTVNDICMMLAQIGI